MTHDEFWEMILKSRCDFDKNRHDGNMDIQANRLRQLLAEMPSSDVEAFSGIFRQLFQNAYRWDLWGAAYIIEGGCSDGGFVDFRYWLISMGREIYEAAIVDVESLVEIAYEPGIEMCGFEGFGDIADCVLREKGVQESTEQSEFAYSREPLGKQWEYDDLPKLFPKLWSKFG